MKGENYMTQNKQELARLIKDISNTKKSIEKAQATIKTKSSVLDMQLLGTLKNNSVLPTIF